MVRRAETRREHQLAAVTQEAQVLTVLVHNRQPLDAFVLGTRLVNKDDARIEVALLTRQTLVDLICNDVADPAPILRACRKSLTGKLLACRHVPKTKLSDDTAVIAPVNTTDNQRIGLNRAPIRKARSGIYIAHAFQERGAVEGIEETGPLQVGGDHFGNIAPQFGILAEELRYGDWDRRERALPLRTGQTVPGALRLHHHRRKQQHGNQHPGKGLSRPSNHLSSLKSAQFRITAYIMSRGSKLQVTNFQTAYFSRGRSKGAHRVTARIAASAAI